jgi:hypothetical protein
VSFIYFIKRFLSSATLLPGNHVIHKAVAVRRHSGK